MNLKIPVENNSLQFSRDIFIFSYLCGGINFTDIANLKAENIKENRLQYTRQKTGKRISFVISQAAIDILVRYQVNRSKDNYLFPILDIQRHKTAIQKENRIHKYW